MCVRALLIPDKTTREREKRKCARLCGVVHLLLLLCVVYSFVLVQFLCFSRCDFWARVCVHFPSTFVSFWRLFYNSTYWLLVLLPLLLSAMSLCASARATRVCMCIYFYSLTYYAIGRDMISFSLSRAKANEKKTRRRRRRNGTKRWNSLAVRITFYTIACAVRHFWMASAFAQSLPRHSADLKYCLDKNLNLFHFNLFAGAIHMNWNDSPDPQFRALSCCCLCFHVASEKIGGSSRQPTASNNGSW